MKVYLEPRDLWVGVYVGPNHIYVCPLPTVVLRFQRGLLAYRAGWPDRQNPKHPIRRVGRGWVRVGPYVIGNTSAWDESGAP